MKPTALKRRDFIRESTRAGTLCFLGSFAVLNTISRKADAAKQSDHPAITHTEDLFFSISLAQWSLHRSFNAGKLSAEDFPVIAKQQFGIDAVEYVNSFYSKQARDIAFWTSLRRRAEDHGVSNLILMVDEEGDLGNPDNRARQRAVENHYKWLDAAKALGCHSVRVNGFGEGSREAVGDALVEGLGTLGEYAGTMGLNVVIENHGLYSSDAKWVVDVLQRIDRENCGTLPDFGNFCTARKWGSTQDGTCPEVYDRYLGVREMMPYAKGVSAKSYKFDKKGRETTIDYGKMMQIVKDARFTGYIGIEYEGNDLGEPEGIRATRQLLIEEGTKLAG